jgi:hypothetical protein
LRSQFEHLSGADAAASASPDLLRHIQQALIDFRCSLLEDSALLSFDTKFCFFSVCWICLIIYKPFFQGQSGAMVFQLSLVSLRPCGPADFESYKKLGKNQRFIA